MLANPAKLWFINIDLYAAGGNGYRTKMSPWKGTVALSESQHDVVDPTHPCGALDDGVEDWLHVGGRAANDAEHLRCSGLMLKCLTQLRVTFLDLLEQPHVLDGDDRLVGKGFEKRDLLFVERLYLHPPNGNASNRLSFTEQRSSQHGSCFRASPTPPPDIRIVLFALR